ncbi:MAG: ABC transporter permease [Defluviitaleaceae bacterium]|nr:ABC transporter permease [Defluviitaleaceae bacterium]
MKFWKFLIIRILTCLLTIWIGVTILFFVPRFFPSDPIEGLVMQMTMLYGNMDPAMQESIRATLQAQFGLEGSLFTQYLHFLRNGLLGFDFGPSLMNFPTPVTDLIAVRMPYTVFLSLFTTLIAWVVGNLIGLYAGFRKDKRSARVMEMVAIFIYPIPYFLVALILQIVFAFLLGWFPLTSNIIFHMGPWVWFTSLIRSSILPALSILLIGVGWWILSMKALASSIASDDFVSYARYRGISESKIAGKYIFRNSMLTQVTALALALGGVFSGALLAEIIFNYPGVGTLVQQAIMQSDYNMIMGTITISIVAISVATLLVDLLYPFFDPRIRYS